MPVSAVECHCLQSNVRRVMDDHTMRRRHQPRKRTPGGESRAFQFCLASNVSTPMMTTHPDSALKLSFECHESARKETRRTVGIGAPHSLVVPVESLCMLRRGLENTSFPGENLSLGRSDSRARCYPSMYQCNCHANRLAEAGCEAT